MNAAQIKHMADRFLAWPLPEDFNPDCGISFQAVANAGSHHEYVRNPTGTNLFDARQATEMAGHIVEGLPAGDDKDAEIARLSREVDRLKADNAAYSAQCKKLADRNRKLAGALDARAPISVHAGTWWYPEGDTSSDSCCHSPDDVVENTVDDMAEGDRRVIVIERALSLPDVYGLIRVFTDAEKAARDDDEPWVLDLYATEDEANAALSAQPAEQDDDDLPEQIGTCENCSTTLRDGDGFVIYDDGVVICDVCPSGEREGGEPRGRLER